METEATERVIIYGAGKYGHACINHLCSGERVSIIAIVDGNPNKLGEKIDRYEIKPLEKASLLEYDKLIIAVHDYEEIARTLLYRGVKGNKLFIYNGENDSLTHLEYEYSDLVWRELSKKRTICHVIDCLLMECFEQNEFAGYNRIIITDQKFIEPVRAFFRECMPDVDVLTLDMDSNQVLGDGDKVIICDENYRNTIRMLESRLISSNQYVLIPLFDVESKIRFRSN